VPRRKPGWWPGSGSPRRLPTAGALVLALSVALLALPGEALAIHLKEWGHNHSKEYIPYRPKGLKQLKKHFGQPCGKKADDARTFFPHAQARGVGGYVVYHRRLALNVGYNIRTHIAADHKNDAIDYGVYGYNCRLMRGGTSWSTHAWGVAIDTNTARNPLGQDHWNGIGADGQRHRRYIPNVWKGWDTGHHFYWGLNFSRPDPHHFQFVTGY
jgi:hypothetical protein